jgi:DGQHR domain-containing protein
MSGDKKAVPALRVNQWLPEWDEVHFDPNQHRRPPDPYFFQFSLPANVLKRLTGVHKRTARTGQRRSEELSTQRLHQKERSDEIADFVRFGFPWSRLSAKQRETQHRDLRKPGWLPTAILINILTDQDERDGRRVHQDDLVRVASTEDAWAELLIPQVTNDWEPTNEGLHPFEVIDGQHRLWAFEDGAALPPTFELPVTAFVGLDRSWQAYLFWSINITPKKINASLAYDLYPLLRGEEWLERFAGPVVYRETRAQELVETLWAHPESPWHNRINMLGEPGQPWVRQAAWVRTLISTFVRPYRNTEGRVGGLFGARPAEHQTVLPWTRPQQAAFLIRGWREIYTAIEKTKPAWAQALKKSDEGAPAAMFAKDSLLNTDQGVRAVCAVMNDLSVLRSAELELRAWDVETLEEARDFEDVTAALASLDRQAALMQHLETLGGGLADFDWRTANAPNLTSEEQTLRLTFRGSGGYTQLTLALLRHLAADGRDQADAAAHALASREG